MTWIRRRLSSERSIILLAVALAYGGLILLAPRFPGLDLPWHGAIAAVASTSDPGRFAGYFECDWQLSSYVVMYVLVIGLGKVVGIAAAMQIVVALYVLAFVHASHSLLRTFGRDPSLCLLAAPAAYSMTLEFGFLSYALAFPLTFWLWSAVHETARDGATVRRLVQVVGFMAVIALSHPFAALLALMGAAVLALMQLRPHSRAGALAAIAGCLAAVVPAAMATRAAAAGAPRGLPGLEHADIWGKLTAQVFVGPLEAMSAAPVRLLGFMADEMRFLVVLASLALLVVGRYLVGAPRLRSELGRAPLYLLAILTLAYFLTPWTFEWPRNWFAAQLRVLPLVWVVALVAFGPGAHERAGLWRAHAAVAVSALLAIAMPYRSYASESRDFLEVVDASRERVKTLILIEQERVRERRPASPFRHFGAWLLVERGGYVSHLPFAELQLNAGNLVPARLAKDAPARPQAPPMGYPRLFDWQRQSAGWDQFLIRDADPGSPHDYFEGYASSVRLVRRVGAWRLYERRRDETR